MKTHGWRSVKTPPVEGRRVLVVLPRPLRVDIARVVPESGEEPAFACHPVWELDCGTTVDPIRWQPLPTFKTARD